MQGWLDQLERCVRLGFEGEVQRLWAMYPGESGEPSRVRGRQYRHWLRLAAKAGLCDWVVDLLALFPKDIRPLEPRDWDTLLEAAIVHGHEGLFSLLCEVVPPSNAVCEGRNWVAVAARHGRFGWLEPLASAGFGDPLSPDCFVGTVHTWAMVHGRPHLLKWLEAKYSERREETAAVELLTRRELETLDSPRLRARGRELMLARLVASPPTPRSSLHMWELVGEWFGLMQWDDYELARELTLRALNPTVTEPWASLAERLLIVERALVASQGCSTAFAGFVEAFPVTFAELARSFDRWLPLLVPWERHNWGIASYLFQSMLEWPEEIIRAVREALPGFDRASASQFVCLLETFFQGHPGLASLHAALQANGPGHWLEPQCAEQLLIALEGLPPKGQCLGPPTTEAYWAGQRVVEALRHFCPQKEHLSPDVLRLVREARLPYGRTLLHALPGDATHLFRVAGYLTSAAGLDVNETSWTCAPPLEEALCALESELTRHKVEVLVYFGGFAVKPPPSEEGALKYFKGDVGVCFVRNLLRGMTHHPHATINELLRWKEVLERTPHRSTGRMLEEVLRGLSDFRCRALAVERGKSC